MKPRLLLLAAGWVLCAHSAAAQVTAVRIASGLTRPLWAGAPAGDERIFIGTQGGQILVLVNGVVRPEPFLDLTGAVSTGSEQGLLGVAFHPAHAKSGAFFVSYTDLAGDSVLARFTLSSDRNVADEASESVVLTVDQPFANHNGGDIHFGPDGALYIFLGDGGSAADPGCRAQRLDTLLGKVLRLDVDSAVPYAIPPTNPFVGVPGARGEIFHYGLRNPWRNGFDRVTGDLYLGDVGQELREEIDVARAGSAGLNFGWRVMEGTRCHSLGTCAAGTPPCDSPLYVRPILELTHAAGSFAVTGGRVYRGCAVPSEYGKYFFSDFADAKIRSLEYDPATGMVANLTDRTSEFEPGGGLSIQSVASFGEDGFGELLICDLGSGPSGEVYKMVPATGVRAAAVARNGSGVNPPCLEGASLPILGNLWEVRVHASAHPHPLASTIVGYAAPSPGLLVPAGERLFDIRSPRFFKLVQSSNGSLDVFRGPLPCDPALAGLRVVVQAGLVGASMRRLCNALDLTLGYW